MRISRPLAVGLCLGVGLLGLLGAAGWYYYQLTVDRYVILGLTIALAGVVGAALIDRQRLLAFFRGRQGQHGTNAFLASLSVLGILTVVNFVSYRTPATVDLTEDAQYSLAPETRATLATVTRPVRLVGFYSQDLESSRDDIRPLLQQYMEAGRGYVSYEFIDPRQAPLSADQYGVTRDGSVVVVMGAGSEVVQFPGEQDITGAIVRLANPGQRQVYFLTGHGERDIASAEPEGYSNAREALESKNYKVGTLNLLIEPQVPEDALAVVVAGPASPLRSSEVEALEAYLATGGSLVVLEDPTPGTQLEGAGDPLADMLASAWGIRLRDDFVVDLNSSLPLYGIAASYGDHSITEQMHNLATYFPTARSVEILTSDTTSLTQVSLVQTGDNSWGETDFEALKVEGSAEMNAGKDNPGPLTLAASAEEFGTSARVVVAGDVDFGANGDYFQLGNGDFLINSIDWAAGQEQLISLTPKETTQRFVVPPTRQTALLIALVTVVGIPGAVVVAGISTFVSRRRRA